MPVSICLFLGNLSGKSNNKNFSDIRYPGSLFRRGFWKRRDRVKSDINTESKIPKFPRLKLSHPVCPEHEQS